MSRSNLALACRSCNIHKAGHLTGFDEITQKETTLFNPRLDRWENHFRIDKLTVPSWQKPGLVAQP
jgi:hypothetical protein